MSNEHNEKQNDMQGTHHTSMNSKLYQVSFKGELNFSDVATIKSQLALDYQKSSDDFDVWFAGKPIILKKFISYEEAKSVAVYFEKLGMMIDIQDMANLPQVSENVRPDAVYSSNPVSSSVEHSSVDYLSNDRLVNEESTVKPAGFLVRFGAFLIDTVILSVIILLVNYVLTLFGLDIMNEIEKSNPEIIAKFLTLNEQSQDAQIQIWMDYLQAVSESTVFYFLIILKILYFALMHASSYQATIGKRILGIMVLDQYGNPLTFSKSFLRSIFLNFPASIVNIVFNFGCLMIFFTKNKQGLHDKIVRSYVIYGRTDISNKNLKI